MRADQRPGHFVSLLWDRRRGRTEAEIERQAGLTPKTLRNWRAPDRRQLPPVEELRALADVLEVSSAVLVGAWLRDYGYEVPGDAGELTDVVEALRELDPPYQQVVRDTLVSVSRLANQQRGEAAS